MRIRIYLLLGIICILLYPMNAEAQLAGKAAKATSKILKSTKGKIGTGVISGAAAMKYLDKDKPEQPNQPNIEKKQCPNCQGNCGYYDFYGYYHTCPTCQGKGVVWIEKSIPSRQISFTGNISKYSNRETCGANSCRCKIPREWLEHNNFNYCPECEHQTGWHHN